LARRFQPAADYSKAVAYSAIMVEMAGRADAGQTTGLALECFRADGSFPWT
jgi:hypothetical protein